MAMRKKKTSRPAHRKERRWHSLDGVLVSDAVLSRRIPADRLRTDIARHLKKRPTKAYGFVITEGTYEGQPFHIASYFSEPRGHQDAHIDLGSFHDALAQLTD